VADRLSALGRQVEQHELVERAMVTLSRPDAPPPVRALTSAH
jgi:hypothetical protein